MLSKKKSVKILVFDDFLRNRWILQNSDVIISFVSSFYIKICILLYYFDQYFLRYKPAKIHQNPGFIPALNAWILQSTIKSDASIGLLLNHYLQEPYLFVFGKWEVQ